jgi:quercetin dioxygenase-like cupin family protein
MARAGQEIDNPAMGARIRFCRVARDTGGSLLEFDFFLQPGGVVATDHLHPHQHERFEVLWGAMHGHVGGQPHVVVAGEDSVVAAGVPHAWRNAGDGEAHLRVQFRPALDTEDMFEAVFALAREGRTDHRGVPALPHRLAMLAAFPHEFRPAGMPRPVHRALVVLFAPLGRRLRQRLGVERLERSGAVAPT